MLHIILLTLVGLFIAAPAQAQKLTTPISDWSKTVAVTPAGGFVMGNPAAKVKLIEYGSLSCPHCRAFELEAGEPLVANYVRRGRVSFEFRSYLRNGYDIAATLTAACGGPKSFFPMIRALYKAQPEWTAKIQAIPADRMAAIRAMPPRPQLRAMGEAAGFPAFATARGIPAAKILACLDDQPLTERLVRTSANGTSRYKVSSTPTFFINEVKVDTAAGPTAWGAVKSRLDAMLTR